MSAKNVTMLDYFAGKALIGLLAKSPNVRTSSHYADASYSIALAMMEAREKAHKEYYEKMLPKGSKNA